MVKYLCKTEGWSERRLMSNGKVSMSDRQRVGQRGK